MKLFDSHCHLDFADFSDDRQEVVSRAVQGGVQAIFVPGVARQQSDQQEWLADCEAVQLYLGYGFHPYFIDQHHSDDLAWLSGKLTNDAYACVGEIGLDMTCGRLELQQTLFVAQLELACHFKRPMVLHHRQSQPSLLKMIKPYRSQLPPIAGVLHAFSGSYELAREWLELGFMLGVGGTITYPRAKKTRATIAKMPLTSLVLETDAPDMPIAGFQGRRNEPLFCTYVCDTLAELRRQSPELIASQTWQNAYSLFNI